MSTRVCLYLPIISSLLSPNFSPLMVILVPGGPSLGDIPLTSGRLSVRPSLMARQDEAGVWACWYTDSFGKDHPRSSALISHCDKDRPSSQLENHIPSNHSESLALYSRVYLDFLAGQLCSQLLTLREWWYWRQSHASFLQSCFLCLLEWAMGTRLVSWLLAS